MAGPLSQLPAGVTFADIQRTIRSFPITPPEIDLSKRLDLRERAEWVFVGARGSGKSTLLRQLGLDGAPPIPAVTSYERCYGALDDNGQSTPEDLTRTMFSMFKHARANRSYKPIVMLRALTWDRIAPHFSYIGPQHVAQFAFPPDAYLQQLAAAGCEPELVRGWFHDRWRSSLLDARGHHLPWWGWWATLCLTEGTGLSVAHHQAMALAGTAYCRQDFMRDLFTPHLQFVVPEHERYRQRGKALQISEKHISTRLLSAMRRLPLPKQYPSRPSFMRAAEVSGIWHRRKQGWYCFSRLVAAGLTTLKHDLQISSLGGSV